MKRKFWTRRAKTTIETLQPFNTSTETAHIDDPIDRVEVEQLGATKKSTLAGIDEDLDNGLLKPALWTSVYLHLAHPEWSLNDIARHLDELHTSTVSRHIKTWTQVQQNIASERSTAAPTVAADQAHSTTTDSMATTAPTTPTNRVRVTVRTTTTR